ncbi:hypothetical protein KTR10_00745 [Candidatus Kaiserbacteria bacterium]|nr:hypothetical protein [Candidatus Kaiserbacteria bacterium]
MELSERYIQKLEDEGFSHVCDEQDDPGKIYKEHECQNKVSLIITDGSLEVILDNEVKRLSTHDRLDIHPQTKLSAVVGPEGCGYVVGEMIKGDF